MQLTAARKIHPMGVKTLLASDVTATVYGIDQAEAARTGFWELRSLLRGLNLLLRPGSRRRLRCYPAQAGGYRWQAMTSMSRAAHSACSGNSTTLTVPAASSATWPPTSIPSWPACWPGRRPGAASRQRGAGWLRSSWNCARTISGNGPPPPCGAAGTGAGLRREAGASHRRLPQGPLRKALAMPPLRCLMSGRCRKQRGGGLRQSR